MTISLGELVQFMTALASLGAVVIGAYNAKKLEVIHIATNSMKDALVSAAEKVGHAEGIEQGRTETSKKEK